MNLQDFYKKLANGRLSNTAMVEGIDPVTIKAVHQPKVTDAINEGLVRLYTRFILNEKDVVIGLKDYITSYRLNSLYSESLAPQVGVPYSYILDGGGPVFSDDVIKILYVYDHDGYEMPLNDTTYYKYIFTPRFDTVQVPTPITGEVINVIYQAKHITLTSLEPLEKIILPDTLYGALEAYVAHLLFADINSDDAKFKSEKQLARYEEICADVRLTDAVSSTTIQSNTKFINRGWI